MYRHCTVFLLLLFLSSFVFAHYGADEHDLGPELPKIIPAPDSIHNDSSIPADDEAVEQVESDRQHLVRKLREIEDLQLRITSKHDLLKRVQNLRHTVDEKVEHEKQVKEEEEHVQQNLQQAVQKKHDADQEREAIAEQRKRVEQLLERIHEEKSNFDQEYAKTDTERKKADADVRELTSERERLLAQVEALAGRFKEDGFHNWLERHVHTLPLLMKETILKTSNFVDPIIERVETAAELNEQITNETTEAITRYLPAIKNSPFYTGLIFYVILLIPLVCATWLVLKIRTRLSMLTVEHYLIAINLYFGILSVACAAMTVLGSTDILIIFRHRSQRMAETFMILHGFLFLVHLVLHGMTAYVSGAKKDFAQYICMSCVGLHFFVNAYKRTIFDQDPNIGAPAYIIYSTIFLYTLYDRGVYILEAAVKDRKADTSAFGTYPSDQPYKLPTTSSNGQGDRTVYFAGLPVFNAPSQSALDDAKTI